MADSTGALLFLGFNAIISSLLVRERMRTSAAVSEIWIYPIKSCRGMKVSSAVVGKRGFLLDRIFMLIDEEGKFVSQRTQPKMALIDVNIDEKSELLTITAPGMISPLSIDLKTQPSSGEKNIACTVWGEDCTAYPIPTAGEWFSTYLGVASDHFRLVRMADDCVRPTDPLYAPGGQAAFSDGFAFLLTSHKSLAALNSRLSKPVSMENFRPNIVANSFTAHAEDNWDSIIFESSPFISMKVVKPCARCKVPTIDPLTGIFDPNNEPTRTIKKFRSGKALGFRNEAWNGEVFFGQNLDHRSQEGGIISVGDRIKIKSFQNF